MFLCSIFRTNKHVGFHTGFVAVGWRLFGDNKQMCAKLTACKPHPSRGVWGGGGGGGGGGGNWVKKIFEKIAALRLVLMGLTAS